VRPPAFDDNPRKDSLIFSVHLWNPVLKRKPWIGEFDPLSGAVFHEHMELMPQAAE
jgi:hypothetical protein